MADAPLADLKVLDLSRVLAGPYASQMFADLGADVIKIEPPTGDETRRFGPPFVGGETTYYLSINRGKRSLALDLKQDAACAVVCDLAAWADVALENFRPGVADKLGVGYDALSAINPRLVYVSISGYGQRGLPEYAQLPGYDLVIQGMGGIPALTGAAEAAPHKVGTSIADLTAGMNAFSGAMAALYQRSKTQRGQHVDVSMLDGQLSMLSYHASAWLNTQQRPTRLGNAHPSICPYETFAARDGFINVACGNDKLFAKLCGVLGTGPLLDDERFSTNVARVQNRSSLLSLLEPQFAERSVEDWTTALGAVGIPCGPILEPPEALEHPHVRARGVVVEQEHATVGKVRSVGCPMGFEQASFATLAPPVFAQHSVEVLRDVLGYSDARIQECVESGAVIPSAE